MVDTLSDIAVRGVTSSELQKYRNLFELYDADGSGCISLPELGDILPRMGIFLGGEELAQLFQILDSDDSGELSFDEFIEVVVQQKQLAQLSLLSEDRDSSRRLQENLRLRPWAVWPDSWARCAWDAATLCSALFFVIVVPLEAALRPPSYEHAPCTAGVEDCDPEFTVPHAARLPAALMLLADVPVRLLSAPAPPS
eukprot:gene8559-1440_t